MNHEQDVAILGLGYVGLTLATVMADVGYRVFGVEKLPEVVDKTNAGIPHFSETGLNEALSRVVRAGNLVAVNELDPEVPCGTYVITVGTPLDTEGVARQDMIESAARQVADHMPEGALVILRSTVKVGTTRDVVAPILAASGKKFDIAMCPERTLEGKALQELRELPQVVGADNQLVSERAANVFRQLTKSIVQVSSLESAEILKLVDNTYRDVQFAFANEVARVCECFGVNAQEVIASGKLGYKRNNVPLPGLVGGPCLDEDPHILKQSARSRGIDLEITKAGRLVNERQPVETMEFIVGKMAERGMGAGVKVSLLGMAFKGVPDTDDLRGSMSLKVLNMLKRLRPDVAIHVYDAIIPPTELSEQISDVTACASLVDAARDSSVVIIANNHPALGHLTPPAMYEVMKTGGFIYDYWNHFSNLSEGELGTSYFAVGNTREQNHE